MVHLSPPTRSRRHAVGRRRARPAFTLIETSLAIVIVGTGALAIMAAQQAYHRKNLWAQRSSTAMLLAREIREIVSPLPNQDPASGKIYVGPEPGEYVDGDDFASVQNFDDVDDFAGPMDPSTGRHVGLTFNPPINATREAIDDLDRWTQHVRVVNVLPDNVSVTDELAQPLGTTDVMRVTVCVSYTDPNSGEAMTIAELAWLVSP